MSIKEQLILLNNKPYKNSPVVQLTVQRNYHVQLSEDHRYYSVPYQYVGKKVKVFYNNCVVEVYLDHERIALHIRNVHQKAYTTLGEHMPHHQRMQKIKGFNREYLLAQAALIGTAPCRQIR